MESPIPLELTEIAFWRLLIMNLELLPNLIGAAAAAQPHLQLPQPLGGEAKGQLVAPPLVFEAVDAPQSLGHRHVENEVGQREQPNRHPAVAALQPWRLGLGQENQAQEDEEEMEELPQLLFLEGLEGRLFSNHTVVVVMVVGGSDGGGSVMLILRHWSDCSRIHILNTRPQTARSEFSTSARIHTLEHIPIAHVKRLVIRIGIDCCPNLVLGNQICIGAIRIPVSGGLIAREPHNLTLMLANCRVNTKGPD
ncbi:shikimate kinase [Striga asiatica]|uniref:Shikimate kinase n=1 Tax=Striga asiatica TaxID=4170 RepID=A0A5A7PKR0_STRAF|nr:shikimate kinase [Striga asiatica]